MVYQKYAPNAPPPPSAWRPPALRRVRVFVGYWIKFEGGVFAFLHVESTKPSKASSQRLGKIFFRTSQWKSLFFCNFWGFSLGKPILWLFSKVCQDCQKKKRCMEVLSLNFPNPHRNMANMSERLVKDVGIAFHLKKTKKTRLEFEGHVIRFVQKRGCAESFIFLKKIGTCRHAGRFPDLGCPKLKDNWWLKFLAFSFCCTLFKKKCQRRFPTATFQAFQKISAFPSCALGTESLVE